MLPFRRWFKDSFFSRLFKNAGILLSGDAAARLLSLASLVLTARVLGAEQFGVLVLVQTYAQINDRLLNFQSWQAFIKYGAEALEQKRFDDLKGYIRLGTLLDTASAFLGMIVAVLLAKWIGQLLGWGSDVIQMATFYSIANLFNATGTPIGLLRLFDHFRLIAAQRIIAAALKLVAILFATMTKAGLWAYVIIWMATDILGAVTLIVLGHFLLHRKQIGQWWRQRTEDWRPFFSFVCWTNLSSTFDIPVKLLDVFIVSSVVSVEAVGVYKVFKQVSDILKKPVDPVYQAIYPQFAALIANGEESRAVRMGIRVGILTLLVSIPVVALLSLPSKWWLDAVFGEAFASEWIVFSIYLSFQGIAIVFISIHPLFIALGYVRQNFIILGIANGFFVVLSWILGTRFGLVGIVFAYGVQFSTVVLLKLFIIRQRMRDGLPARPRSLFGWTHEDIDRQ